MVDSKRAPRLAWSAGDDQFIRANYASMSAAEMAQALGRSPKAVYNYVSRLSLTTRDYRPWSDDEMATLRELYESTPVAEVAGLLGRDVAGVVRQANRAGLNRTAANEALLRATLARWRPTAAPRGSGFPVAEPVRAAAAAPPLDWTPENLVAPKTFIAAGTVHDYFSSVTTAEQAYVIGLLAADGNIGRRHPRIILPLEASDMRAVEFVRDRINPAARLSFGKDGMARLHVTSRQQVTDLARYGIVPRKSRILRWAHELGDLRRPYLLGYFDGDGSSYLAYDRRGRALPGWNACSGSEQFLVDMKAYILEATGVRLQKIQRRKDADLWQVSVTGLAAVVLDEWLHQEPMGMERKRPPLEAVTYYD